MSGDFNRGLQDHLVGFHRFYSNGIFFIKVGFSIIIFMKNL